MEVFGFLSHTLSVCGVERERERMEEAINGGSTRMVAYEREGNERKKVTMKGDKYVVGIILEFY